MNVRGRNRDVSVCQSGDCMRYYLHIKKGYNTIPFKSQLFLKSQHTLHINESLCVVDSNPL
jgi:hypothetical protein